MVPQRATPGNDPLPHSRAVLQNGATASALPAIAEALTALLAHDVAHWPAHGFVVVKQRTVRSVLRGSLAGVPVFVKVYRPDTLADRLRDLVRAPRGAAECRALVQLRSLGLPAVEPIAHGLANAGASRCSFLVTRALDAAPFAFATAGPAGAERTGALLRTVHDLRLAIGDLHAGNLLLDATGAPTLLDPAKVRRTDALTLAERAEGLAFFCQELDGGALDPAARPLLRGYLAAGDLPAAFRAELTLATHRLRADALPAFGRRATRSCKHTEVPKRHRATPRWHWHLPGLDASTRARCEAFAAAPTAPTKTGRRGSVWLQDQLVVKERDAGKAQKVWRAAYWLLFARVPQAAPIALRLHAGKGFVFSQRLPTACLADELRAQRLDPPAIAAAAHSLGAAVGRLHAHGLGNRDLKFENLVRDPTTGEVHVVDLDGVRRRAANDSRGRGADLGRLLAAFRAAGAPGGAGTLRAFLRAYLRAWHALLQEPPLRRLLRRAEQRAGEWASAHR